MFDGDEAFLIFGGWMFEILAFGIALAALIFSRKALNRLREAEARIAALEEGVAPQRTIVVAAPSRDRSAARTDHCAGCGTRRDVAANLDPDAGRSGSSAAAGNAGRGGHRPPRDAPASIAGP